MSENPSITVAMSVFNGARHLYSAVQSILDQDFTDFEFLIINDGSTDNSGEILREFAACDSRIQLIERENKGLVASLNEMLAIARAPLFARMDCDDIAMPKRLSLQYHTMNERSDIAVLGTNTHELDDDGILTECTDFYPDSDTGMAEMLKTRPPLCHPSIMARTDIMRQIGGYRAAFAHAEDYDLWLRISRTNRLANLPDRLLLYRRSPNQISQKYSFDQSYAAAFAYTAHVCVMNGQGDPFETLSVLPTMNQLSKILNDETAAAVIRKKITSDMRYSRDCLLGAHFETMIAQARSKYGFQGAWRTVLRLMSMGEFLRAKRLFSALAFGN